MNESTPRPFHRRHRKKLIALLLVLVLIASTLLYLRSNSFQNVVRERVIAEVERATGGRVEIERFHWDVTELGVAAEGVTVHGTETADEPPLARIEKLAVQAKVFSWLGQEFGIRRLRIQRPEIFIVYRQDGSSNIPRPDAARHTRGANPIATLFRLQIDDLAIEDGLVTWNQERFPLELSANKVHATMSYAAAYDRYDGNVSADQARLRYKSAPPLSLRPELSFQLFQNELQLPKLRVESPRSRLEGEGKIADLREPVLELNYRGQLDVAEWAPLIDLRDLRGGNADVSGSGSFTTARFETRTRGTVRALHFQHGGIQVRGATAAANVVFDGKQLRVTNIVAQMLGGVVKGSADLVGLGSEAPAEQHGRIELETIRLDLPTVIAASRLKLVEGLPLNGGVSGPVQVSWQGAPANAIADFDLRVEPPTQGEAAAMPVSGAVRGRFAMRGERLELTQADLTTPSSTLRASGTLAERAEMTVQFETSKLSDFEPLIRNAAGQQAVPIVVQGKASFRGTVKGTLKEPAIRGQIGLSDFDSKFARGTSDQSAGPMHWDSFRGEIDYSSSRLAVRNGELRRGDTKVAFSGNASLTRGKFDPTSAIALQTEVRNLPLTDAQNFAGTDYPITGVLSGDFRLGGTRERPRGEGKVRVENLAIYGEQARSITADVRLNGQQLSAENIQLTQNGGRLTGSGSFDSSNQQFTFSLNGAGFDLAHFRQLDNPYAKLGGVANLSATGSGTLARPTITGKLRVAGFAINGEALGDFHADASTVGRELRLTAQTEFQKSSLRLAGTAQLAGEFPARGTIQFTDFDVDTRALPRVNGQVNGRVTASGNIEFSGPLKNPRALTFKGEIPTVRAVVENIELTNDGPLRFEVANQALTLTQFHVKGEGTNLQATGTLALAAERQINFRAQGEANLRLFQGFNRDLQSYGNLVLSTQITGTLERPELAGQIQIQNGGVAFIDLPNGLSEINGLFVFDQNRLRIQSLSAKTGGGLLNIVGTIAFRNGLYFDLTAKGNDIRLRYPEGVSSVANAELHLTGTTRSSLLSGDVLVTKFGINPRFDFALYLARSRQVETSGAQKNPVLDNMRLDVHVITTADLRVETSLAKLSGDADLRIRGTAADPAVLGRINIVEGNVVFSGTQYNLERGDILFINPRGIDPVLNLEATARVREYDITIGFHGKPTALSTTYRSEPPLPTADIIALIALGRTRDETRLTNAPEQSFSETAQNAILGQALDAAISNRVQRLFGVSRIKIDPQVGGPENATARVTIEQQVNNNVTLTYITNLSSVNQQIVQAEFNVSRNVSLVVVRDYNGVLGIDVKVRQRKR